MPQHEHAFASGRRRNIFGRVKKSHTRRSHPSRSSLLHCLHAHEEDGMFEGVRGAACLQIEHVAYERRSSVASPIPGDPWTSVSESGTRPFNVSISRTCETPPSHPTEPTGRIYLPLKSRHCGSWDSPWPSISSARLSTMESAQCRSYGRSSRRSHGWSFYGP